MVSDSDENFPSRLACQARPSFAISALSFQPRQLTFADVCANDARFSPTNTWVHGRMGVKIVHEALEHRVQRQQGCEAQRIRQCLEGA
jgi:hypothetical protein